MSLSREIGSRFRRSWWKVEANDRYCDCLISAWLALRKSSEISVEGEVRKRRRQTKRKTLAATFSRLLQVEKRWMSKRTDFWSITMAVQVVCGRLGQFPADSLRKDGPSIHSAGLSSGLRPWSAGFCLVGTYFQSSGSDCRVISLTLWATKLLSLFCRCIQSKTTQLSVQNFTTGKEREKTLRTIRSRRTRRTAASSSSFGMLFCLIGETWLFPMTKICWADVR